MIRDLYNSEMAKKLKINSKSMKFTYMGYVEAGIANLADAKVNVNAKLMLSLLKI